MKDLQKIKIIAFDKDGTLLDFEHLWLNVLASLVAVLSEHYKVEFPEKFQTAVNLGLGVTENGIDPHGVYGKGTEKDILEVVYKGLVAGSPEIVPSAQDFIEKIPGYTARILSDMEKFVRAVPGGSPSDMFKALRSAGFITGIVTNDSDATGRLSLKGIGLSVEDMDFFYSGDMDNLSPKPAADIIEDLCSRFSLKSENIAIVGDTPSDMLFANDAGAFSAGVLSGVGNADALKDSDRIFSDIYELADTLLGLN